WTPAAQRNQSVLNSSPGNAVLTDGTEHFREQGNRTDPHDSEVRVPIDDEATLRQIDFRNDLLRQIRYQTFPLIHTLRITAHDQHVVGARFHEVVDNAQALPIHRGDDQTFELIPVILAFG